MIAYLSLVYLLFYIGIPYHWVTFLYRSTHAWILSGGTNTGSMKLVGETVKEGQFLVQDGTGNEWLI